MTFCGVPRSSIAVSNSAWASSLASNDLAEVPSRLREGAELVLDGGKLPGTPSTVVDLREFDQDRRWHVLREGALARSAVQEALDALSLPAIQRSC